MRVRMLLFGVVVGVLAASPVVAGQGLSVTPTVSAAGAAWYRAGEPIPMGDALYYPSGPITFFDTNTMVLSGVYEGVPIYTDTTREPFSFVLVPIGSGQVRPYERRRTGSLAGATGNVARGMPVMTAVVPTTLLAPGARTRGLTNPAAPLNAIALPAGTATSAVAQPAGETVVPVAVGTTGRSATPAPAYVPRHVVVTTRRPESNDGIWIEFRGVRWVASGRAVPLEHTAFVAIGTHAGYPVFARAGETRPTVIYLPTLAGYVAPYRLRQ